MSILAISTLLLPFIGLSAAQSCSCYTTDSGDIFTNHNFFDFRNLQGYGPTPPEVPTPASDFTNGDTSVPAQSGYLQSSDFTDFFNIQAWGVTSRDDSTYEFQNEINNVYVGTFLYTLSRGRKNSYSNQL
jgi:hypothetical protein